MAPHDWMLLAQLTALFVLVLARGGASRAIALALIGGDIVWLLIALASVRTVTRASRAASAFYRASLVALALATYLELRWILPVVAPRSLDADILAFDLRVFGIEPAIAWDHWVTPRSTEWFAFFYYSYFFILALHALPSALALDDGPDVQELTFGLIALFCIGHVTYALVPVTGPHAHVQGMPHRLEGGFFWHSVEAMVESAGVEKDGFPSLHTAAPLFLALYGYRHRSDRFLRYVWPVTALFSAQIIIATMFLRWHYLADIVAGVVLAIVVGWAAPRVVAWDDRRRRRSPLPPALPGSPFRWTRVVRNG